MGKTSIINKYVKNVFYEKPSATVGVDFANKILSKDDLHLKSNSTSTCDDLKGNTKLKDSVVEVGHSLITGEDVAL